MSHGQTAKHSSWVYAEEHTGPDPVFESARVRAADLGSTPVSAGTAAVLGVLAAAANARALAEIGTGAGISGAALMRGAARNAVLTSIDVDPDHIAAATETFRAEGLPTSRTRLITGDAQQVLPRLNAGGYDLVFVDAEPEAAASYADEGLRLIRSGGLLIINDALDSDRVPKPAVRGGATQTMRDLERSLREDERLTTALFSTGSGLLIAVKR